MPFFGFLGILLLASQAHTHTHTCTGSALLKQTATQGDLQRQDQCLLCIHHGHVENTHRSANM